MSLPRSLRAVENGWPIMPRLRDIARLIRSKNAGPFELTFDVLFANLDDYRYVKESGVVSAEGFARIYRLDPADVRVYEYEAGRAIKISIDRTAIAGSPGDADAYGAQQFGPLVDLEIPGDRHTAATTATRG